MNTKSAVAKGKRFENFICDEIDRHGLGPARREIGSGNGKRKGDIAWPGLKTIEAKNEASVPQWLIERVEQAERQDISHDGYALIIRDPRSPEARFKAFAVIDFNDWLEYEKAARAPKSQEPDRELKYKLLRAKSSCLDAANAIPL